MTLILSAARVVVFSMMGLVSFQADRGLATRFGDPDDRLAGEHLSCMHRRVLPDDWVCAHRTLPCGTIVLLHNPRTNQIAACEVLDRGPFGAILPNGKWGVKIRHHEPGQWRGIIDLAPAVAQALGHNGRENISLLYTKVRDLTPVKRKPSQFVWLR